ncbi:MAG: SDR family oxidoreductase [Saprospiraceae bacterium]|nr:SDR family oxidoreductase [Saprospiraceae bacterium]
MKNYLIIGESSGIGQSLTEILSQDENQVYATFNSNKPEEQHRGVNFHFLNVLEDNLDFSFLPETLDAFAYCPGAIDLKPFHRIKPESFIDDYRLQVVGAVKTLQMVLPRLKAAGKASVVLFSTVAVQTGFNFHSQVAASKGAIEGLTRSLAAEWAPNIRVNCIAPSLTDTPLAAKLLNTEKKLEANAQRHPLKKIGTPQEIAQMAGFLLSENSSWITGQVMHVDGGLSSIK